ncbi:MAG: MBL fold metallo-hydrolase [candidate division Zixibacteria bacterium]|nr:MBL fold metallo-hydrolase [candidate division Zixibacteria bacterium]
MLIDILEVGMYLANCYIIGCEKTRKGIIIDPGDNGDFILSKIKKNNIEVEKVVLTHGHLDHIGAVEYLRDTLNARVCIHEADAEMLFSADKNLSQDMPEPVETEPAEVLLKEGMFIEFGEEKLKVLHTPGHTKGGISLVGDGVVFTGDALFLGSVGRTDLPGGDFEELMNSIREKLFALPDETIVYSGHGPDTTIGQEKQYNPFVR